MTSIASRLRYAVAKLRTRPVALSLLIPLMQEAADELERLLPPEPPEPEPVPASPEEPKNG